MPEPGTDRSQLFSQLIRLAAEEPEIEDILRLAIFGQVTQQYVHEINNYLTGISGYTNLLIQSTGLTPKIREFVQKTLDCSNAGQSLSQSFRNLFPRKSKVLSPADSSGLIPVIVSFCEKILGSNCKIHFNSSDGFQSLSISEWIFKDIVLYSILCANELIRGNGKITIDSSFEYLPSENHEEPSEEWFFIRFQLVHNPEATQFSILDREHQTRSLPEIKKRLLSSLTWNGLNLLIENCNGRISLTSDRQDSLNLIVQLPVSNEIGLSVEQLMTSSESIQGLDRPLNLVLLEDQELTAEFIRTLLERDGHHVRIFLTGTDIEMAIQSKEFGDVDVFILDICVPGRSGLEIGRMIRDTYPDSRIVFYSALSDIDTIKEIFRLNNQTQFLCKPFKKEELFDVLNLVVKAEV